MNVKEINISALLPENLLEVFLKIWPSLTILFHVNENYKLIICERNIRVTLLKIPEL